MRTTNIVFALFCQSYGMIPIEALLNRIRWDKEFAKAEFVLGYDDRMVKTIRLVPLHHVFQEPGDHFFMHVVDEEGQLRTVPLHRIRKVWRNGELIWQR